MSLPTITSPPLFGGKGPEDFFRLTVPQYHEMIDNGILGEDDPVELLDGCLITKMSKNLPHRFSTGNLRDVLAEVVPKGYFIESQDPIALSTSEPEPDTAIIRGRRRDFVRRHASSSDIALVIEVADDSLDRDRNWKRLIYAKAGIPIYWIVNLVDSRLEVYEKPVVTAEGADYSQMRLLSESEQVPLILDGVQVALIAVRELLP